MRTRYLYVCPRGFANETALYQITTPAQLTAAQRMIERFDADTSGVARFIRSSEAEAHCRANRQLAKHQDIVGAREIEPMPIT